jgi:hypothetical protein
MKCPGPHVERSKKEKRPRFGRGSGKMGRIFVAERFKGKKGLYEDQE